MVSLERKMDLGTRENWLCARKMSYLHGYSDNGTVFLDSKSIRRRLAVERSKDIVDCFLSRRLCKDGNGVAWCDECDSEQRLVSIRTV